MSLLIPDPTPPALTKDQALNAVIRRTRHRFTQIVKDSQRNRELIVADITANADGLTEKEVMEAFGDDAGELKGLLDTAAKMATDVDIAVTPTPAVLKV